MQNRKTGEAIILDSDIEISVADIQADHTKAGIDAPKEAKSYREEVHERMADYIAPPYG